jgi:hypothetical protein
MILSLFAWLNPHKGSVLRNNQSNKSSTSKELGVSSGGPKPEIGRNKSVGVAMSFFGKESPLQGKQSITVANADSSSRVSKGNPWLAIIIALSLTAYLVFALFSWVSQEHIFQREMFSLQFGIEHEMLPRFIELKSDGRYVTAKLLTFYLSYPLVIILSYLIYQWLVTSLHRFGSYCAKVNYVTPEFRLRGVAFAADIAPVFGIMSSLWALMNKGGDDEYVRWVMCGPSFLGMTAYAMATIYLHLMPAAEVKNG